MPSSEGIVMPCDVTAAPEFHAGTWLPLILRIFVRRNGPCIWASDTNMASGVGFTSTIPFSKSLRHTPPFLL